MVDSFMNDYFEFTKKSNCPFSVCENVKKKLKENGYKEYRYLEDFTVSAGDKIIVDLFSTGLVAINISKNVNKNKKVKIAAAHSDFPGFVIKPGKSVTSLKYSKLNVECYGGAILNTWLDRPLGIAGIVVVKGEDTFSPRTIMVDSMGPIVSIPNVAIHFNRDVNKGVELNKQKDLQPVIGILSDELSNDDLLMTFLEKNANVNAKDILDFSLYLYNASDGVTYGINNELFMAPRIDNLASVYALMEAMVKCDDDFEGINCIAVFDNEEVGSKTKQAAASNCLLAIMEKVNNCLNTGMTTFELLSNGFFLSVDGAHAVHPNATEKYDPNNYIFPNDGVVIKKAASQSYATDSVAAAIVKSICVDNNIDYKVFVNKSDMPGGSTLGAIASTVTPIRIADVGIPMLAMHSAMESAGVKDIKSLTDLVCGLFSCR